jgi:hypothetical protein
MPPVNGHFDSLDITFSCGRVQTADDSSIGAPRTARMGGERKTPGDVTGLDRDFTFWGVGFSMSHGIK